MHGVDSMEITPQAQLKWQRNLARFTLFSHALQDHSHKPVVLFYYAQRLAGRGVSVLVNMIGSRCLERCLGCRTRLQ
jgi:hypothetical protein